MLIAPKKNTYNMFKNFFFSKLSNFCFNKFINFFGKNSKILDCTFSKEENLSAALERIQKESEIAARQGVTQLILSDKNLSNENLPIPMLLCVGAINTFLINKKLRGYVSINAQSGEAMDTHSFATLLGVGATTVNPYLAFDSLYQRHSKKLFGQFSFDYCVQRYINSVNAGLLKIMSKMGISVLSSYRGGCNFETGGLSRTVVDDYFPGITSKISGIGLTGIEKKIREEVNSLADKVKNMDYEQAGSTLKKKSKSFSNNLASLILSLIKIAGKLVGIMLIIFASLSLFGITLGFITTNVVSWVSEFPLNDMMNFRILETTPIWLLLILGLCVLGIPVLFLLILGIKLVAPRSNPFSFWGRMILLGVWLLSVIVLVVLGSLEAKSRLFTYQAIDNYNYAIASQDTLQLKALKNAQFQDRFTNSKDFDLIVDENGEKQLLLKFAKLRIV